MGNNIQGNGVYRFSDYQLLMLNGFDIFFGIITTILILYIGRYFYKKKYIHTKYANYFWYGLQFRLACVWLMALVFTLYYQGGDSTMYHSGIIDISHESWSFWWEFLTDIWNKKHNYSVYGNINGNAAYYIQGTTNAGVVRLGLIANLISFDSYMGISLWFSFFAFIGLWRLYRVFLYFYPSLYKELGLFILFLPSAIFWSSALLKDPLCIGSLGLLMYYTTSIFFWRQKLIISSILAFCFGLVIFIIKPYIIIAFAPALFTWLFLQYNDKIKNKVLKSFTFVLMLIISILVGMNVFEKLTEGETTKRFAADALIENIKTQGQNFNKTGGGSKFDLGEFDPTPMGLIKKFPAAVNATLYRPYLWEMRNPLMLISAVESTFLLVISIIILYRYNFNIFKVLGFIVSQPLLLFSLIFTLIFAGAMGLTTFNFGALVRYKIPCLPFFGLLLGVLWYKSKEVKGLTKPNV